MKWTIYSRSPCNHWNKWILWNYKTYFSKHKTGQESTPTPAGVCFSYKRIEIILVSRLYSDQEDCTLEFFVGAPLVTTERQRTPWCTSDKVSHSHHSWALYPPLTSTRSIRILDKNAVHSDGTPNALGNISAEWRAKTRCKEKRTVQTTNKRLLKKYPQPRKVAPWKRNKFTTPSIELPSNKAKKTPQLNRVRMKKCAGSLAKSSQVKGDI